MKKLASALALVFGLYGGAALALDGEKIVVEKGAQTVTIGGMTVPLAAVVVGAVIAGVVIVSVAAGDDDTTVITVTTTTS